MIFFARAFFLTEGFSFFPLGAGDDHYLPIQIYLSKVKSSAKSNFVLLALEGFFPKKHAD